MNTETILVYGVSILMRLVFMPVHFPYRMVVIGRLIYAGYPLFNYYWPGLCAPWHYVRVYLILDGDYFAMRCAPFPEGAELILRLIFY